MSRITGQLENYGRKKTACLSGAVIRFEKVCSAPEAKCSVQNGACQHKSAKNLKKYMYVEFDSAGPANDDGAVLADALLSGLSTSSFTTEVLYSGSGSGGHSPSNACALLEASGAWLSTDLTGFSVDSGGCFLPQRDAAAFFARSIDACACACACSQVAFRFHAGRHLSVPLVDC